MAKWQPATEEGRRVDSLYSEENRSYIGGFGGHDLFNLGLDEQLRVGQATRLLTPSARRHTCMHVGPRGGRCKAAWKFQTAQGRRLCTKHH